MNRTTVEVEGRGGKGGEGDAGGSSYTLFGKTPHQPDAAWFPRCVSPARGWGWRKEASRPPHPPHGAGFVDAELGKTL